MIKLLFVDAKVSKKAEFYFIIITKYFIYVTLTSVPLLPFRHIPPSCLPALADSLHCYQYSTRKKTHGQIEFVRIACPDAHNRPIINALQATGQIVRTNSICPCYFFMRKEEEEKGGYGLRREPVIREAITWHPRNYDLAHKNLCFPPHKTMT